MARQAAWAKSATLVMHDGEPIRVRFQRVPVARERMTITATVGWDDRGRPVVTGVDLSHPMSRARLHGLPLAEIHAATVRALDSAKIPRHLTGAPPPSSAVERLAEVAQTDRSSDEFLSLVALVCREARKAGRSGDVAVGEASGRPAMGKRYVAAARARGLDVGVLVRTSRPVADRLEDVEAWIERRRAGQSGPVETPGADSPGQRKGKR